VNSALYAALKRGEDALASLQGADKSGRK